MLWKHRDLVLTKLMFLSSDLDIAIRAKCLTMSTDTCRENTVKHIDTAHHPLHEILWCSNSHKIVRLGLREMWCEDIHDTIHVLLGLTDGESAYCHSWSIEGLDELC